MENCAGLEQVCIGRPLFPDLREREGGHAAGREGICRGEGGNLAHTCPTCASEQRTSLPDRSVIRVGP